MALQAIDRRLRFIHVAVAFLAAAASVTALQQWALPRLTALAADRRTLDTCGAPCLFDARPRGYSYEDAKTYLDALGPNARDYYATWYVPGYDLAFPVTLFVFGILFCLWMTQPGRRFTVSLRPSVRLSILLVPIGLFVFDILENLSVLAMLRTYYALSPGLVAAASFFTQAKWIALYLGLGLAPALLVFGAARWLRRS